MGCTVIERTLGIFALMLISLGVLLACSEADPVTNSATDLSSNMAEVVLEADRITEEIVLVELSAMDQTTRAAATDERSFSRSRSCPGGGELFVEGSIHRTWDPDTGVMEADITGSRTRTDCVFVRGDMTITVNGGSMWDKFRRRIDGRPDGLQTSHYSGSWVAVSSTGEERTCSFDYTVVRDPDTQTRTVEGTMCAGRLSHRMSWDPNLGG
jgi:hypothetical protein